MAYGYIVIERTNIIKRLPIAREAKDISMLEPFLIEFRH